MSEFLMAVGFGLVTASVLAIASVGLSLQFGITNYINFAYGDFMALGAYISYEINGGILHLNIWVALVLPDESQSMRDGRVLGWGSAAHRDTAVGRKFLPGNDPEKCRFTGPISAE